MQDINNEKIKTYTLLSEYESNVDKNIINYKSPFSKTFLNCRVGDIKEFNKKEYEVIEIKNFKY